MDYREWIKELESELKRGGLFKKIDTEKCLKILSDMSLNLPDALQEAYDINARQDVIIKSANEAAAQIIKAAEEQAQQMVSESELVVLAKKEAVKILDQAEQRAEAVFNGSKEHLKNLFTDVENFMVDNLGVIRNNREDIDGIKYERTYAAEDLSEK